ncbi:MAG TPA: flavodoxin family protein [Spirochaetota bacterium]|nr:flavodoxin family protein [Spirochaetota bacterium]HQQ22994.1 flavodoxin family protein [Spirochaetota bacterium]
MKKVTAILGSPRRESNTEILLNEALRGAKDRGFSVNTFYLNEMRIKGCQACYFCKENNTTECAVTDDMYNIYSSLHESSALIIATPVYFGGVTAQTKLFTDRMFPFIDLNVRTLIEKRKKASFIFTQNQPHPFLFRKSMDSFAEMFSYIGFDTIDILSACGLDKGYKPMVSENKEIMNKAYELGLNICND